MDSLFSIKNIRLYILFRVLFNARFYYPVFTILFLDFGLSLEQFAILNAVWAATIVMLEVPSGALADVLGRRNLLRVTGILMVVEIGVICFVPLGHPGLLFAAFLINRILSGTAEAAASGADEALAYDTLKVLGRENEWGLVLDRQMRYQSVAFIVAMSVGAAVYDPDLLQRLTSLLGMGIDIGPQTTLRFPLYLTFVTACLTLITVFRMEDPEPADGKECREHETCSRSVREAFRVTFRAGAWIFRTPFALAVILAGMIFDHVLRMVVTLGSQYYRIIQLPEASFGLIGSSMALVGVFIPRLALRLSEHQTPGRNLLLLAVCALAALAGISMHIPVFGLIPVFLLSATMMMNSFFVSHYLNRVTATEQRATVLSFKGLAFNFAYGLIGILYSLVLAIERGRLDVTAWSAAGGTVEDYVFVQSLAWFPWYLLGLIVVFFWLARRRLQLKGGAAPEKYCE